MLEQLSRHSLIDLTLRAEGDLHIDFHHTTEDTGYVIGEAVSQALGDRRGIARYGHAMIPMDETLTRVTLDASNRPYLIWKVAFTRPKLGEMDTELFKEWFQAFAQSAGVTLHVENLYGENNHHIVESCFKGLARALRQAVDDRSAPRRRGAVDQGRARRHRCHEHRRHRLRLGQSALGRQGVRAGGRGRRDRDRDRGVERARGCPQAPTASCCPASAPSPIAGAASLRCPGSRTALDEAVRRRGRPFLGICVGMQLMAERGREFDRHRGARLDPAARSSRSRPRDQALKMPHMGWNELSRAPRSSRCSPGSTTAPTPISSTPTASPAPMPHDVLADTDYGGALAAVVGRDNLVGTQFHPEKSQEAGLALIANFLRWRP